MSDCGCDVRKIEPVEAGFSGRAQAVVLRVAGMDCRNCAHRVHNALVAIDGVLSVQADLATARVITRIDPRRVQAAELPAVIATAGAGSNHHYQAVITDLVEEVVYAR